MYLTESTYKYVTGEERDRLSDYLPYDAYDLEKGALRPDPQGPGQLRTPPADRQGRDVRRP